MTGSYPTFNRYEKRRGDMKLKIPLLFLVGLFLIQLSADAADESGYGYRQYEKRVKHVRKTWQKDHIESGTYQKNQQGFIKGINAYNKKRLRRPSYKAPRAGDRTGQSAVRPPQDTTNGGQAATSVAPKKAGGTTP